MSTTGQQVRNGKKNGHVPAEVDTPDKAYARGIRECYGVLTIVVNELPTETRIKYTEKLQELFEKVREAEKRAGEGAGR